LGEQLLDDICSNLPAFINMVSDLHILKPQFLKVIRLSHSLEQPFNDLVGFALLILTPPELQHKLHKPVIAQVVHVPLAPHHKSVDLLYDSLNLLLEVIFLKP
jgi:type II secretory pathway predicted ATPase ExeA